jgi:hypothetical protein
MWGRVVVVALGIALVVLGVAPNLSCFGGGCSEVCDDYVSIGFETGGSTTALAGAQVELCLNGACATGMFATTTDKIELEGPALAAGASIGRDKAGAVVYVSPTSCIVPTISCSGQPGTPIDCCPGVALHDGDMYSITVTLQDGSSLTARTTVQYEHQRDCGDGCLIAELKVGPTR